MLGATLGEIGRGMLAAYSVSGEWRKSMFPLAVCSMVNAFIDEQGLDPDEVYASLRYLFSE